MAVTPDESQFVLDFFADADAGIFVEVSPGRIGSPGAALEARGWTGVLVEPQPDLAAFLVTARSAKVFAVACVSPDQAGQTVPLHMPTSGAAPFVVLVPARTLDDILDEAEAAAPLDLLAVDAAGYESDALLGFDFDHWQPRLVALRDRLQTLQAHRLMRSRGYRLIRRAGDHSCYVPVHAPARATGRERWRIVREYYLGWPFRLVRTAMRRLGRSIRRSVAGR